MLQEYLLMYAGSIFISVCWAFSWFTLSSSMLHKDLCVKRCIGFGAVFCGIQLVYNHLVSSSMFMYYLLYNHVTEFFIFTIHGVLLVLFLYHRRSGEGVKTISSVALGYFFLYNFFYGIQRVAQKPLLFALGHTSSLVRTGGLALLYVVLLGFSLAMAFVLRKVQLRKYWGVLFSTRPKKIITMVCCLLLMHSYRLVLLFYPEWEASISYSVVSIASIFIILLFILFLAMYHTNKSRLSAQQALLYQQQAYVQSLEKIQGEVRAFRHDYQNMMAGLYLQAQEGDVEGVQAQIQQKLLYFDENLAGEIRQTTFLANVHIPEVKSLLAVKLMQMHKAGVVCEMEIVSAVTQIGMETEDFVRVFGILLDNAAEAAAKSERKFVGVIVLAEAGLLRLVVKNTYAEDETPALGEIWKEGYSTKGNGRGTGLASYRQILSKYAGSMPHTMLEQDLFVQELVIKTGGRGMP